MTVWADTLRATTVGWNDVATYIDNGSIMYCGTSGGSANAQTLTTNPTFATSYTTGMSIRFKAGFTSTTTTPTININSISANTLKRNDGSIIVPGDITTGEIYDIWYDGTNWRLLNPCEAWKTWSPTLTGFSANPASAVYRYKVDRSRGCTMSFYQPSYGTSNATTYTATLPITAATVAGQTWIGQCQAGDNGALQTSPGLITIASAGTLMNIYKTLAAGVWTNVNGKLAAFEMFYEV